ncbi:hypothetical protein COT83_05360 [Candidatus Peregrinibacteria bacterium CG10_big_fil_rev_8_21_14_0_10_44_7]|nr:MAG: hypothetical protein COT83_05360 [Candidatus Peregrinibacteria bacterium CG10_big_fil_rev_8_21_14_0_10_44_7]
MGTKIKYAVYALAAAILFVPIVFMGGVDAGTCFTITGTSVDSDNTGAITPGVVCADASGVLSGYFISDNIGNIYLDHNMPGYANASFDMATGVWSGYAYAPLNAYEYPSSYGTFFDLSNLSTSISTGAITGYAYSSNLGTLYFTGLTQELPPVYLTASVGVKPFGNLISGVPVADLNSGYRVFVTVSSYDGSYVLDQSEFTFGGTISADGNMCYDQVDGTCGNTQSIVHSTGFTYYGEDTSGNLIYYFDIKSLAPTSDMLCNSLDDYENCLAPDTANTYAMSGATVTGDMDRDFVWYYGGKEYASTVTLAASSGMSFAPIYEVDELYPVDVDLSTVANVSVDELYNFEPVFVKNGQAASSYRLEVYYAVDDSNYSFGDVASETSSFNINNPNPGSLWFEDAFDDIGLWTSVEDELAAGAVATVTSYITVNVEGATIHYPSENFFFADLMAGIAEPRTGVIGTVSGLVEEDDVTVVGDVNRMELRDVVFEQVMKVIRGISSTGGNGGSVYSDWTASSDCESLISGGVIYCTGGAGDVVTISGGTVSSSTAKTILVVGADVYIAGNIERSSEDGGVGIIVLEDEDGNGGNLYVGSSVTDLHANIFLDGSVMRANSSGTPYTQSQLTNQLYILGSIISQNTIGGVDAAAGPVCGDGDACSESEAQLYDFGYMSAYQVCYPYTVNPDGSVTVDTSSYEECPGYSASSYEGDWEMQPVIIEYMSPTSDLPVFNVSGSAVR